MKNLILLSLLISLASCSDSQFAGTEKQDVTVGKQKASEKKQSPDKSKITELENASEAKLVEPDDYLGDSPADTALKACLKGWGKRKIAPELLDDVKILEGSSNGPLANSEVADLDYTDEPALILVSVSTNGPLAGTTLKLMNPKGMYCISTSTNGPLAGLRIEKHCRAKIGEDNSSTNGPLAQKTMEITACD